jgi:hypothetical protein
VFSFLDAKPKPLSSWIDRKILDMLPDRPPQVTFSCDKPSSTCNFQFWIGQQESFYCALDTCNTELRHSYDTNITQYDCQHVKCSCIPGRMLCGEAGSVGKFPLLRPVSKALEISFVRYWRVPHRIYKRTSNFQL